MATTDRRVDAYIEKAADFAKPILKEIRARVHEACPDCEETMKWSTPAFDYNGPMCGTELEISVELFARRSSCAPRRLTFVVRTTNERSK